MSALKSQVGKSSEIHWDEISPAGVSSFCQAVGIPVQLQAPVPSTFLTLYRKGEYELFQTLGIDLTKILHTDQEYQFERPVFAGERLRFQTKLSHALEKARANSLIQFLTFETEFHVERDSEVLRVGLSKTNLVVR